MCNIFLDNQAHIYIFENIDSCDWHHFNQLHDNKKINIVLSLDNLIEFSQSNTLEQAVKLTQAVMNCSPKWIDSFLDIQKQEIRQYIFNHYLKKKVQGYNPYKNYFTDFFRAEPVSPIDFITFAFNGEQKNNFQVKYKEHTDVLTELQTYEKNKIFTTQIEKIALNNVIASRLYQKELDQLGFNLNDKRDLISFCLNNSKKLYEACPSLNTERHLTKYRRSDPKRKSKLSDTMDLTMSTAAFPYVDVFITNDRFLYNGLEYVSKKIKSIKTKFFKRIYEYEG